MDIKDQFVPYELAKLAKENGFNNKCMTYYTSEGLFIEKCIDSELIDFNTDSFAISAPLWQQLVDWLEKDKLISIDKRSDYMRAGETHGIRTQYTIVDHYDGKTIELEFSHNPIKALTAALTKAFELI